MTGAESCLRLCVKSLDACGDAMAEVLSALDELENVVYSGSVGDLEDAVSVIDSCLEELEDQARKFEASRTACEGCPGCAEPLSEVIGLGMLGIKKARSASADAVEKTEEILKETPSDGEQEEESLEDLQSVAEDLLGELRGYFNG